MNRIFCPCERLSCVLSTHNEVEFSSLRDTSFHLRIRIVQPRPVLFLQTVQCAVVRWPSVKVYYVYVYVLKPYTAVRRCTVPWPVVIEFYRYQTGLPSVNRVDRVCDWSAPAVMMTSGRRHRPTLDAEDGAGGTITCRSPCRAVLLPADRRVARYYYLPIAVSCGTITFRSPCRAVLLPFDRGVARYYYLPIAVSRGFLDILVFELDGESF